MLQTGHNGQGFVNMEDYGYEGEDPNHLAMSNSDIYLMFGGAGGPNPNMILIPSAEGGQILSAAQEDLITI